MLQGTGSDVGKSILVAGLCRLARQRGLEVAPFKPQNMSNNAAACKGGGEIGRAQALQALAAGIEPHVHHNPVLLKPETDRAAQVVLQGRPLYSAEAATVFGRRGALLQPVLESFRKVADESELVIVEGAGSPAEINLREGDIANMGFARAAGVPVCLVGDIERGGVIASLVGTQAVLDPDDAATVRGFLVNKFRGDPNLFTDGVTAIEQRTGWPCFGVVPWLPSPALLPAEDAVSAQGGAAAGRETLRIVAPMLSRIANFDDADPLRMEPGVDFRFIPPGRPLPRDADLVLLFGTKSTLGDLDFLRRQGWDVDIHAHVRAGGRVLGICGGYQLLGQRIVDAEGFDGAPGEAAGLGLLDVETKMVSDKTVRPVSGTCAHSGAPVRGYEIHVGRTDGPDCRRPMLRLGQHAEGATSPDGLVEGTYLHGMMVRDEYRSAYLQRIGAPVSTLAYADAVEEALDELASGLEDALDIDRLFAVAAAPNL